MTRVAAVIAACLLASRAFAALPPLSPADLASGADTIVVGVVEAVDVRDDPVVDGQADRHVTLRVRVESVEKGAAAGTLEVTGWHALTRPGDWVGHSGVYWLEAVTVGRHVRVYSAGGRLLEPNGLQLLELAPAR